VSSRASQRVPRAEARRRIVAATSRLLRTRRFRELTVDAVMAEAGLARTVFYRYFDGLPHVVVSLLDEALADVVAVAESAPAPQEPDVLWEMLVRTVQLFVAHGPVLRALDEAARLDPDAEAVYRAAVDRSTAATAELLARGVEAGHIPPLDPLPVARALMMLNGHYLLDALGDGRGDPDVALRTLWTIWSRTLGAGPPQKGG
jgi:AcrR family transcriptional regulator